VIFETLRHCGITIGILNLFLFTLERQFNSEPLNCPIKDVVMLKAALVIELFKKATQEGIVGRFLKLEISTIVHVRRHFFRVPLTQEFN